MTGSGTTDSTYAAGGIRLSVIIPTYNCRDYLGECIQSVLRQLPPDCELILSDDGSDDGTAELLPQYEGAGNVRAVYHTHRGASAARNAGLDVAAGEFVTFIDCDDCMREGFLCESLPMLDDRTDLYIFGIERIPLSGDRELWTVRDSVYPDVSAFADEYVRTRQLMIYSNCNMKRIAQNSSSAARVEPRMRIVPRMPWSVRCSPRSRAERRMAVTGSM